MVPSPLNTESPAVVVGAVDASKAFGSVKADSLETKPHELQVSFSHVQLYVDGVEDIQVYKDLESKLNEFARLSSKHELEEDAHNRGDSSRATEKHELWQGRIETETKECDNQDFVAQNRDVVKQLLVGFGFRVTGYRFPSQDNAVNTRSVLVTSRDLHGVQIVVTAASSAAEKTPDDYLHFDEENLLRFFRFHAGRQGIAVLGFHVNDIKTIYQRYQRLHPNLIHAFHEYEGGRVKVFEVFAYYVPETPDVQGKQPDVGTVIRFIEVAKTSTPSAFCLLPGLKQLDASFDGTSQAAYCDHWVSNVFSRTEFLSTLEDTLGFTPKVDFNAGVVAAGEAQIESTVTGNEPNVSTVDKAAILRDQSQVYLPINNALSSVGHVHGFLQQIGQGIQHVASRVENLVAFVQNCNEMREVTGEGFTFLKIPRSYYGVLTAQHLVESAGIAMELADKILAICGENQITFAEGAVDLTMTKRDIAAILDASINEIAAASAPKKDDILDAILSSRYANLHSLLRDHVSEETYLGIVRNQILVDVQGEDVLYQIFTCKILHREPGDEAPFFEFIQRVCSECEGGDGCPAKVKPGCGGFGIRNFLTLFLSIEVSKAMLEAAEAKDYGDERRHFYAQKRVDCFTRQLNDSNPILTEISDAMTLEGFCKQQLESAESHGDVDAAVEWTAKMEAASARKQVGNENLMECSAQYEKMMRSMREAVEGNATN